MPEMDFQRDSLRQRIYNINDAAFPAVALDVFHYQYQYNPIYRQYCEATGATADYVSDWRQIPFLPISAFRHHLIKTGEWQASHIFRSSGTTTSIQSQHAVRDLQWYHQIASIGFESWLGPVSNYVWIGLLPSYLERPDSSLVSMVTSFMNAANSGKQHFYPFINHELLEVLRFHSNHNTKVILLGVSFAILDLFEHHDVPVWENLLIMETGGMKGRREELTRSELHHRLLEVYPELRIASEYGMTELFSQAYAYGNLFAPIPAMQIRIRDAYDPLSHMDDGKRGGIDVIDLANIDTCSFIATDDIGIRYASGQFEVLGRMDQSDIRGCNLMYEGL